MKKFISPVTFFLVVSFIFGSSLFTMEREEKKRKKEKPPIETVFKSMHVPATGLDALDLVIILDDGHEERETKSRFIEGATDLAYAMTERLGKAIHQRQNILVSSSLVSSLFYAKNEEPSRSAVNLITFGFEWSLYTTPDKNFCLFLYDQKKSLRDLGFNNHYLELYKKYSLKKMGVIKKESLRVSNIFVKDIEKIVRSEQERGVNYESLKKVFFEQRNPLKFICLAGHGRYKKSIAGLSFDQYEDLLHHFEKIGCMFLYVTTCYSGGSNLMEAHKSLTTRMDRYTSEKSDKFDISFPLVIEGITDSPTTTISSMLNYQKYFTGLHQIFGDKGRQGSSWVYWSLRPFSKIIADLSGSLVENFPQVRLPNSRGYFTPNSADESLELLTYPALLKQEVRKEKTVTLKSTCRAVLLYPSVLRVPLLMVPNKYTITLPNIISMIPGNAQHYIEELIFSALLSSYIEIEENFNDLIKAMFIGAEAQQNRESSKLFFIKKITYFENDIKRVKENIFVYTFREHNQLVCSLFVKKNLENEFSCWKHVSNEWKQYLPVDSKYILTLLKTTTNSDKALLQSSGGRETKYSFCNALKHLFPDYVTSVKKYAALREALADKDYDKLIEMVKGKKKINWKAYQKEKNQSFVFDLLSSSKESLKDKIYYLKFFINDGLNVNYGAGQSFLHRLAQEKNEQIKQLIPDLIPALMEIEEIEWNVIDNVFMTPLHKAAAAGNILMIQALLKVPAVRTGIVDLYEKTAWDIIEENTAQLESEDIELLREAFRVHSKKND